MSEIGFFRRDGDGFVPLPLAQSLWGKGQLHGVAVGGLLARALEAKAPASFVPARFHVDLFRPARTVQARVSATIVREGPRLVLVDAIFQQAEVSVARASAVFLMPSTAPTGELWTSPEPRPVPPPVELAPLGDALHIPLFASDKPWSNNFGEHQNRGRHETWQVGVPIVADEEITPFQAVASLADNTSLVTNWSANGVEYINADVDLALSRRPVGVAIGLRATDHVASDGVAVGTAEVFDRLGPLGTATVTAIANTRSTVDMAHSAYAGGAGS